MHIHLCERSFRHGGRLTRVLEDTGWAEAKYPFLLPLMQYMHPPPRPLLVLCPWALIGPSTRLDASVLSLNTNTIHRCVYLSTGRSAQLKWGGGHARRKPHNEAHAKEERQLSGCCINFERVDKRLPTELYLCFACTYIGISQLSRSYQFPYVCQKKQL